MNDNKSNKLMKFLAHLQQYIESLIQLRTYPVVYLSHLLCTWELFMVKQHFYLQHYTPAQFYQITQWPNVFCYQNYFLLHHFQRLSQVAVLLA